jgi:hypothetical protein
MDVTCYYLKELIIFLVTISSYPGLGSLVGISLTLIMLSSMNYSVGVLVID